MSSASVRSMCGDQAALPPQSDLSAANEDVRVGSRLASSVSVDIKAFKGKGAFRSLSRQLSESVAQTRDAMSSLARDTARFDAGCYLRLVEERGRGAMGRARLRWCIRGQARYVLFEALERALTSLPPAVVEHFHACEKRAMELNVLESVLRQAVDQLESYLRNGALRQKAEGGAEPPVLLQNRYGR